MLREVELGRRHRFRLLLRRELSQPLPLAYGVRQLGAVKLPEARLVIEQVQLRRAARVKEKDDSLGSGGEVRQGLEARGVRGFAT